MSGGLPVDVANMASLVMLNASLNMLEGRLNDGAFVNASSLQVVDLSHAVVFVQHRQSDDGVTVQQLFLWVTSGFLVQQCELEHVGVGFSERCRFV